MRVKQYVHFDLRSLTMTAAEMTSRLGIGPDELRVRGSRRTEPRDVPWAHIWTIECRLAGMRVDEQLAHVLDRLEPHAAAIAALTAELRTTEAAESADRGGPARVSVARWFDMEEGEEEDGGLVTLDDGRVLQRAGGQHQLLGWLLDRRAIAFLAAVGADLDVDEYG